MDPTDIQKLLKHLELARPKNNDVPDDIDNTNLLAKTILFTHLVSRKTILDVANKLIRGSAFDDAILPQAQEIPLPVETAHDLHLGDWVEIKYGHADFKSIQKRSLGWNARLNTVYGHQAVVTQVASEYDNSIQLHFPEIMAGCTLYAPLLRKLPPNNSENMPSRWQPGQIVKAESDPQLAKLLQRGFENIPKQYLGARGRVTAVTKRSVDVTFDDQESHHIHPSALEPSDDKTPIQKPAVEHARGFKVGETAKMIKNVKKLVHNQSDNCAWDTKMIELRGEEVTIVDVQADGTVGVQPKHGSAWKVNSDSVLKLDEREPDYSDELEIVPGDIVKIQTPNDLRLILNAANIPLSFLDFLRFPLKVVTVDDDLDIYVCLTAGRYIDVKPKALRPTTKTEADTYTEVNDATEKLKMDDTVCLDVGPPNYVRDVLASVKMDESIKMAMTRPATLIGFAGPEHAVIKCSNGLQYKINKKYLTVPDKFNIINSRAGVNLETAKQILDVVSKYVKEMHNKEEPENTNWKVDILSMSRGAPPSVDLKVQSLIATAQKAYAWLSAFSGWNIKSICDGHLRVTGVVGHEGEIKVGIFFNDEELGIMTPANEAEIETRTTVKESGNVEAGTKPIPEARVEQQRPIVENLNDFNYIRFSDPSLQQDVYFPYVLHGQLRTPRRPENQSPRQTTTQSRQVIVNIAVD